MILIQFPDRETEIKGLAVLISGFSGKVLRGGLHIVPEPALEALTAHNISYAVKGPATYEHEALLKPQISAEEISRRLAQGGGRPLADILHDLEKGS